MITESAYIYRHKFDKMKKLRFLIIILAMIVAFAGCKKKEPANTSYPMIVFKFVFDSTQVRLNNFGQPDDSIPAGHAAQSPEMNFMSAHYIELAPTASTALGQGQIIYTTPETAAGGDSAIDFQQETLTQDSGIFFQTMLQNIKPGTYQYLRVSLAYQNYNVGLYYDTTISGFQIQQNFPCTVASFIGVNSYITTYKVSTESIAVNGNRLQGYWGFEATGNYLGFPYNFLESGQAPANATTVVNPLFATSPIPAGSCVVTAAFNGGPLTITGKETQNIVITVSLSTNHGFEWVEQGTPDGLWEPGKGETIVNMGIRGMIPYIQN
jgi:hypothetical protein